MQQDTNCVYNLHLSYKVDRFYKAKFSEIDEMIGKQKRYYLVVSISPFTYNLKRGLNKSKIEQ